MKSIYLTGGLILLVLVAVFVWHHHGPGGISDRSNVRNFDDCVAAGNPVGESYPRQCWTPDGQHFVEDITPDGSPTPGPITLSGEITCLPKLGGGPRTMECAVGLKGKDGYYYSLKNLFEHDPNHKFLAGGTPVTVSGTFSPEAMTGPDGNAYDIVGVITIDSIH